MGKQIKTASPLPVEFSSTDMKRLLFDVNSTFNPLHPDCQVDYHVAEVRDGYVHLALALPEGMTRAFVTLLESLTRLLHCVDVKSRARSAEVRVHDVAVKQQAQDDLDAFKAKVVARYDQYVADGCESKEATKRTLASFKVDRHPWASYFVIDEILRKAGKYRKKKQK